MAIQKVRVVRLGHVVYQHPDLDKALTFLFDFGFVEAHRTADRVYLRGYGVQPYVYVAEKSPDDKRHFVGAYWVVESAEELEKAASNADASAIHDSSAPGGGQVVTVQDPNGFKVGFIHGQELREKDGAGDDNKKNQQAPVVDILEKSDPIPNGAIDKRRKGKFRRFDQGASPVHKLGHFGFVVPGTKFESTLDFYTSLINLKPTDAVFNPVTGKDETCFCHIDLGPEFTDHHSFFVAAGPEGPPVHIHHSSYEVNDFDTQTLGHDWLRNKGWTNCWGIGRHVLGSQIFDYWFDASGNIIEHYSDGDLVNQDTPFGREPAAPGTLHVWGPNIPLAFLSGRVEDAGKPLPPMMAPPDAVDSKPAQLPEPVVAT